MNIRRSVIGFGVIFSLIALVHEAEAFWVWTPETGRWINPKYAAKETAEEQFRWAQEFYDSGDYARAIAEWRKLIKRFPSSELASEAQYHIGLALQASSRHYEAFLAYQKVLDDYPKTRRVKEVIEKEYQIANLFYTAQTGGGRSSAKEKAVEIFRKVVEGAPYGEHADIAQYKIGLYYMESGRYQEAIGAFDRIVDGYPNSDLLDDARFQIAGCLYKCALKAEYDQEGIEKAINEFEDFIQNFPDSNMVLQAKEMIARLNGKEAERAFEIAQFYERQGQIDSAVIYYKEVRDKYGQTSWASGALERIIALERESGD